MAAVREIQQHPKLSGLVSICVHCWSPVRLASYWAGPTNGGTRGICNCCVVVLSWEQVVIDARDPRALGYWWARALDWSVTLEEDDEFEIRPAADVTPGLLFVPVADDRVVKNRLHLDFRPDDQAAEVQRLLDLGAVRADVGPSDVSWVVLRDPEGNEFCVLGIENPLILETEDS